MCQGCMCSLAQNDDPVDDILHGRGTKYRRGVDLQLCSGDL
jgi:hypothetical protein